MPLQMVAWAAGLRDAKVRNAAGTVFDINAIVSIDSNIDNEQIDVTGDDERKATFVTQMSETLTITANALTFDAIQAITGNTVTSSVSGMEVALGTDSQGNPPYVEIYGIARAKNADGSSTEVKKIYHKVQILSVNPTFSGGSEMAVTMEGRAFQTSTDIMGVALASARIATIKNYVP